MTGKFVNRKHGYGNLFYVMIQKIGLISGGANVQMFKDFMVNAEWVFAFLQGRKIHDDEAERIIIRGAKNVPRLLANLRGWQRERDARAEASMLEEAQEALRFQARPFLRLQAVDAWLQSFSADRWRYKFLVLEGASCLGKTAYCQSLCDPAKFFYVDCASATEPEMRQYSAIQHETVLFDEASVSMIIRCKRLFQAAPCNVTLGQSATNCNSYKISVYKKKLIVASNTWSRELAEARTEHTQWVQANSVHVVVTRPLWKEETSDEEADGVARRTEPIAR
jgi:hypothetical protein